MMHGQKNIKLQIMCWGPQKES